MRTMSTIVLTSTLLLTACPKPTTWVKPGTAPEQASRDHYECERDGQASIQKYGPSIVAQFEARAEADRCLRAKGYRPLE